MQRTIIIGLNIVSIVIILTAYNFWNNLLLFLLVGAIPGTSFSLSPVIMLLILITGSSLLAALTSHLLRPQPDKAPMLPKKRYGRI